jgi:hypothetical protein
MNILVRYKRLFTLFNIIVITSTIVLYHIGFFAHVSFCIFIIICLFVCALAIYRPILMFALFVGVLPLEIINIAPEVFDLSIRPYQIVVVSMILGILGAIFFKDLYEKGFTWNIFDTLIILFLCSGIFSSLVNAQSLHVMIHAFIFTSFGLLYFVTRFFVREKNDIIALLPIIISSGAVISVYAIVQNVLFKYSLFHFEVMPGRPNATFTEPDWLGVYLVFVFGACITYLYYNAHHKHLWKFFDIALYGATMIVIVAMILTVARSAWIGVIGVVLCYFFIVIAQKKYKLFARHFIWVTSVGIVSMSIVFLFDLTNFEIRNRIQSTTSGMQQITVSCHTERSRDALITRGAIDNINDLEQYNCRHINLEDVAEEEKNGSFIVKIDRHDPNTIARRDVYIQVFSVVKEQPVFGYGWGRGGEIFGNDESGTPLNASNIFFEIAIASGMIGAGVFITFITLIVFSSVRILRSSQSTMHNTIAIMGIIGTCAILVPNMFNAGLLMGFVWVYFGMIAILRKLV